LGEGDQGPRLTCGQPRPTCMPSFILIRPTVWPQYTSVRDRTDRQDNGPLAQGEPFYKRSPKKIDSIRTKLMEEIHFEVCHSSNLPPMQCCALAAAAAVDDRCADPEMLHPHHSADLKWGRSELGAQSGRKNQLACLSVCLFVTLVNVRLCAPDMAISP